MLTGRLRHARIAGSHCVMAARPGRAGRVPLVLIHGAGGSVRHWRWVLRQLPGWFAPLAVDLPGHGDSGGPVPDDLDTAVAAVAAVIRQCYPGRPVAVAGHSMGGLVAIRLAAREPDLVSHLALVATAAQVRPHPELMRQISTGEVDDAFLRGSFSPHVGADRVAVVADDLRRTHVLPGVTDLFGIRALDLTPDLGRITAPAVVVIADRDPVISPRRSRLMAAALGHAHTVVLPGGHYLHIERPDAVTDALVGLCRNAYPTVIAGEGIPR